jgi:hypothetical protein
MSNQNYIGNLMHLYLDEIEPGEGTDSHTFLIKASAQLLSQNGERNWVPIIVKEIGADKYEVIGNSFIYAVAEETGLDRVWCIIADDSTATSALSKVLAGEAVPKINLSTASRDDIMYALDYLIKQPGSLLKQVKLAVATNRIDEAPLRPYWTTLDKISDLKCSITKGAKVNALKQIFYLDPQPIPDTITDPKILDTFSVKELKDMAKKRGIAGISNMRKADLVDALSKSLPKP